MNYKRNHAREPTAPMPTFHAIALPPRKGGGGYNRGFYYFRRAAASATTARPRRFSPGCLIATRQQPYLFNFGSKDSGETDAFG